MPQKVSVYSNLTFKWKGPYVIKRKIEGHLVGNEVSETARKFSTKQTDCYHKNPQIIYQSN